MLPTSPESLASLSHELRTPLTSIIGLAEMLEEGAGEHAGYAERIRSNGEELLGLIEDILTLARLAGDQVALDSGPTSVTQLLETTARDHAPTVEAAGGRLVVGKAPDCPPVFEADAGLLRLALRCLFDNALKFAPGGTLWLRAELAADGGVRLELRDEGAGVPDSLGERVFEDFRQGDERITREHGGAGLGLALARRALRAMGGEIALVPCARGACFALNLPPL